MKNFIVKKVGKKNAEKVRLFCLEQIKSEYGYDYVAEWHADLDSLLENSGMYSKEKNGVFLTAWLGEKLVGTLGLRNLKYKKDLWEKYRVKLNSQKVASIWRTYTDRRFRGKGIASRLLVLAEKEALKMGYEFSYLHTSRNKSASLKFWENRGYQIIEEESNEDGTIHMLKKLE